MTEVSYFSRRMIFQLEFKSLQAFMIQQQVKRAGFLRENRDRIQRARIRAKIWQASSKGTNVIKKCTVNACLLQTAQKIATEIASACIA